MIHKKITFTAIITFLLIATLIVILIFIVKKPENKAQVSCQTRNIIKHKTIYPIPSENETRFFRIRVKQWGETITFPSSQHTTIQPTFCTASTQTLPYLLSQRNPQQTDSSSQLNIIALETSVDNNTWHTIEDLFVDVRSSVPITSSQNYNFENILEALAQQIGINTKQNQIYSLVIPAVYEDIENGSGFTIGPVHNKLPQSRVTFSSQDRNKWQVIIN